MFNSHTSPTAAPQVGQDTAKSCFAVRSLAFTRCIMRPFSWGRCSILLTFEIVGDGRVCCCGDAKLAGESRIVERTVAFIVSKSDHFSQIQCVTIQGSVVSARREARL